MAPRRLPARLLLAAALILLAPVGATAQNYARFVNGSTVNIAACDGMVDGIVDDGGANGSYSNYFDGTIVLTWDPGALLTLQGNYYLENNYDRLTLDDGTGATQITGSGYCNYSTSSGTLTITFHTDYSVVYDGFILTWTVSGTTGCTNSVTGLYVTNIGTTSATLGWNATNPAGPFYVICDGDTSTATTNSITLTGLNASSQHSVTVMASGETSSCCRATLMFRTTCDTVHMPWAEGFEGMPLDTVPVCWTVQTNYDSENSQPRVVNNYASEGNQCLMLSSGDNYTGGHFGLAFSPRLDLGAAGFVRFTVRASHSSTCLVVGTCNLDSSYTTRYDFIPTDTVYVNTEWEALTLPSRNIAAGRSLAFYMLQSMQSGSGRRTYIDAVALDACGISAAEISAVESDAMTVTWTTYGAADVTLHVRAAGSSVDLQTITSATSPVTLTGLTAATYYNVILATQCGTSVTLNAVTADSATTIHHWCLSGYSDNEVLNSMTLVNLTASLSGDHVDINTSGNNRPCYFISPEFVGLAGKQIAVRLDGYYATVTLGLMRSRSDTSTFTPLDTRYTDYFKTRYLFATIPDTSTATFVALRHNSSYYYVHRMEIGDCLVDSLRVVHRRGSSVVLGVACDGPTDTILVEYGPTGFTPGTGTVVTFVGQRRLEVTGLYPYNTYDFLVSRPCTGTACSGARLRVSTAAVDYPMPFCEDFSNLYWDNYGYGYWSRYNTYDNTPAVMEHPYYYGAGMSLKLSSFGFRNDYYSSAILPDVPIDSNSVLSFYATNMAPDGHIALGNYYLKTTYGDLEYRWYDTLELAGYGVRQHFIVPLPPTDSILDGRIMLRYWHNNEYQDFSVFLDEVQITHATYLNASVVMADSNNADIVVSPYTATDTLFEVTLRNEIDAIVGIDTVGASETAHFSGLSHCTTYKVYVRPLLSADTTVCPSYATFFNTACSGAIGVRNCHPFTNELSYELPYGWTSTDPLSHSVDSGYLHLYGTAGAELCMPWYGNISGRTLSFLAVGHGTLEIGYADTTFNTFIPFDTVSITAGDTARYTRQLPDMPSDTLRIGLRSTTAGDTIQLDHIGVSLCQHINITIDGNTAICTSDDPSPLYYLFVVDTAGNERMFMVNTQTFSVNGLMPGWEYDFSWQCAYDDETCRPHLFLQTDNQIKVPYCIDFTNGTPLEDANAWEFLSPSPSAYRYDASNGVWYYHYYSLSYLLLPKLDTNATVATLDGYMWRGSSSISSYNLEIGVLTNGSDTSSFLSLWSAPMNSNYFYPKVDLSGHAGQRIAIRNNSNEFDVYRLFIHPYSPMTVRRPAAGKLELLNTHGNYYVRAYQTDYGFDTIIYVDSTYYLLDLSNTNLNNVYLQQVDDSLGSTCRDDGQSYKFSNNNQLSWCWYSDTYFSHFMNYGTYSWTNFKGRQCTMFYGSRYSQQLQTSVLPEMDVDSVRKLNIKFSFASEMSDTQAIVLGVMTDAYDTSTFVPVDTVYYQANDSSWVDFQVPLSSYTGTGRWVAFRYNPELCTSSCDYSYSYICDFCIDSCYANGASAKLVRWNTVRIDSPSGQGGFYAVYHRYGYSDYTIIYIDSVPYTLTLPGDTKYEFYFRCDSSTDYTCRPLQEITTLGTPLDVPSCIDFEDVSLGDLPPSWTRHDSGIQVVNTYSASGSHSLVMPITSQSYVVTGDIATDTLNQVALTIWLYTTDPNDYVEVGAMTNPTDLSSFHVIRNLTNRHAGIWERHIVILANASVDAHYIGLRARGTTTGALRNLYIDDLHMTPCAVSDMRLSNVNPTEFTVEWQQAGTPNITIVVESNGTVVQTLNPTSSPTVVSGLNPQNPYTIHFSSNCGDTGTYCTSTYVDSATIVAPSESGGCINPTDLYSPQATFFSGTYNNPYAVAGAIDYGIASEESRHTVCYDTSYRDPRTGGLLRAVPEGQTTSLRLGNWSTNSYAPEAEGVIYSLTVDTNDFQLILLRYAAVLQDPMHAAEDQPRFRIEVLDSLFSPINPLCTSADFIADASLGWNVAANSVLWKDWTSVGIDLSAYHGQQAYVRLTTYDCNEGSHYGYAYFTLECMRKNMETTACGAIDSNTFTAPAGFNYRWYTSQSNATISTDQSITRATADITYYCDLTKIDNANCSFTISAYGGTRYPMASADTSMTISGCHFHVNFTNTSTVSADGITPLPGEECESAFWNFGNGQTATTYNASTVYTQPGTYTVMLVSGIAGDACKDTLLWPLVIDFPTHVSITGPDTLCHGILDTLHLHDATPALSGEWILDNGEWILPLSPDNYTVGSNQFSLVTTDAYGCMPEASHILLVNPTYRHMDTLRICSPMLPFSYADTVFDVGTTGARYDYDVQSIFGCDSSYHLWLSVSDTGSGTASDTLNASICDNQSYTFFGGVYTEPGPHINVHLDSMGFCDSIHTLLLDVRPTSHTDTLANECDQFTWHGVTSTIDTTMQRLLQNSVLCDSTVTLGLTLRHSTDTSVHHYIVENQLPYSWNGLVFTADTTGCIYHTTNVAGCDSTITFALTIYYNSDTIVDSTVCEGQLPLVWNGVTFSTSDPATNPILTLQATLTSSQGADSVVTMQLHLLLNSSSTESDTLVQNQLPWIWNGLNITADDMQIATPVFRTLDTATIIPNAVGCDSTIGYSLLVYWNRQTLLDSTICDDMLPLSWEGLTFTQAGTLDTVLHTTTGADSTLTLTLTVHPTYDVNDTLVFCPTQAYQYEGVDYGGPTQFDAPHLSVFGCDSMVHVVLTPRDTNFHLEPLYSFDGSNWQPLDTTVFGCAPDTLYLRDATHNAIAWAWTAAIYDTVLTSTAINWSVGFDSMLISPSSLLSVAVTSTIDGVTCIDTISQPVYIFRTPKAEFDWNPPVPALDNPEVQFTNLSIPFDSLTYLWRIPPQAGSLDYDTTSEVNPFYHWGQDGDNMEGDYDVQLVAFWLQYAADTTIHHVCTDTAKHTVTITNDYLQFPNLVTPNGDGNNDIWRVVNLIEYGNFPTNELWIFNQWGVEVYHVRDIREESDFWDPNATASPDGTYYYRFSARGPYGIVKHNGVIEVLRK